MMPIKADEREHLENQRKKIQYAKRIKRLADRRARLINEIIEIDKRIEADGIAMESLT